MHDADAEVTARDLYDLAHLFGGVPATIAVFMTLSP